MENYEKKARDLMILNKVKFIGAVNYEGFGRVVIEAQAMKLPVLLVDFSDAKVYEEIFLYLEQENSQTFFCHV